MSYYKPSFSQTLAMARGRGFSSPRGNSYRGGSSRGNSWGGNGGRGGYSPSGGRFNQSFSSMESRGSFESRAKYGGSSERFSRPHPDDYHKSYRDSGYMGRDGGRRSPERKRMRMEAPGSRHDSSYGSGYGSGRHEPPSGYSERRGYSGERHSTTPYRKEDFRRSGPPMRGSYRGRLSSRGSRGLRARDRPGRRRLIESSYAIRKRVIPRSGDFNRRLKITRLRSTIARRAAKRKLSGEKEGEEGEEKDTEKKEGEEEGEKAEGEEATGEEGSEKTKKETDKEASARPKKRFIKLLCPHCSVKCLTFRKYEIHLSSKMHMIAMRKIALKQKSILAQMRQAQRKSQNELEKSSDDLAAKTNFCPLCKLNYKQKKSVHQLSESHKNMKKFLMPFCKVCSITFKSPMIFESHICSIDHMKRKQRTENAGTDGSADENDLENFTTIDSVGDGDDDVKKEDEKDTLINVGIDQIRKIEAHYCDLCKMYLPRGDEEEMPKILTRHCKQRVHMQRYVRFRERQNLEKRAEKLQRKEQAEKEKKEGDNNPDVNGDAGEEGVVKTEEDGRADAEDAVDDKLWADVDKDLGDILAEAESGNKSSDEDEEDSHVNGERYDRFKLSEKNDDDKLMKEDEESILDSTPEAKEAAAEKK